MLHFTFESAELKLRGKSTTLSHRAPIYYVDLVIKGGMTLSQAVQQAKAEAEALLVAGFGQAALDEAARLGFACGAFEESEEEGAAVVEEFYPEDGGDDAPPAEGVDNQSIDSGQLRNVSGRQAQDHRRTLGHKLGERLKGQGGLMESFSRSTTKSAVDDEQ